MSWPKFFLVRIMVLERVLWGQRQERFLLKLTVVYGESLTLIVYATTVLVRVTGEVVSCVEKGNPSVKTVKQQTFSVQRLSCSEPGGSREVSSTLKSLLRSYCTELDRDWGRRDYHG